MTPKNIAAFALGPIGGALLGFITLPIITWLFSQEDIGRYSLLSVVVSFSTLLFSLGLDQAYVREFHNTKSRPALFKTTLLPGLLLLLITLSILLSFDNIMSKWLFQLDNLYLSLMIAAVMLSTFVSRFLSLILRMNERGFAYSMSQVLPKLLLLFVIGTYVLFSFGRTLVNLVFANVISMLFVCVIYAWNTRKDWLLGVKSEIDFLYLQELLTFGLPLIFGGLAFWGLTATDKILLKEFSSYEQLGLYSVAVSFAAAATIFQSVFSTVWAPLVYKWASSGTSLDKIDKVNRFVLLAVIFIFCMAGMFSWIVPLLLPEEYTGVQWLLIPCLGHPLLYTLSETTVVGIGITKKTGYSMLAAIIAFLINILGNLWLIPSLGATGAAISTCLAFWVFFVLRTEFAIFVWKPVPRLILYSYTLLLVSGALASSIYGASYAFQIRTFWILVLSSVGLLFKVEIRMVYEWAFSQVKRKKYG